jgi:hypothetical protein
MARYEVTVEAIAEVDDVPGRVRESGLRELAVALGATDDEAKDAWAQLDETFRGLSPRDLGESLMEAVLWQPPIPAYCETLMHKCAATPPPWVDHDVPEDRVNLWYAHHVLHRVFPETYPAPTLTRITLSLSTTDPAARPPVLRTPPKDRVAAAAVALLARPTPLPLAAEAGTREAWAFDVLWAVEGSEKRKVSVEGVEASVVRLTVTVAPQWRGDLAEGERWSYDG